ncbi:hypothetical protein [Calothrix sp. PCC 6303]|uniref:hypothetical protein n=1 Tax=Calothrix sp. PCC 6303 TaxID=1170562 RepID=UPI0002A04DD6|nr:hypothetical protein [Calothrix sp. PCC 6303]AFZ03218.1 hypothetical protein Cal6303_4311 [Calothrix sp. PCC 6303]
MIFPKLSFLTAILTLIITAQPVLQPIATADQPPIYTSQQIATNKLPKNVFLLIQKDIQKRFRVSPKTLQLSNAKPSTWDGCLGLAKPDRFCTQIAISGWQVIVSNKSQNRFWVYHTNENGQQLAYNTTASLPRNAKIPTPGFVDKKNIVPTSSDSVIFQSAQTTGNSRGYYAWELTSDGVVTRRLITPNPGKAEKIKQLSQQQVKQFVETLNKNSFSHFNGLGYLNMNAVAADAVSYQLSYGGIITEYTDTSSDQLPTKLNRVISAWDKLIQTAN